MQREKKNGGGGKGGTVEVAGRGRKKEEGKEGTGRKEDAFKDEEDG